jgi:hypothetical protein
MSYKSLTKYDEQLKSSVHHFRIHEPMLPFIGEHYEKHRILLISESHYLPESKKKELDNSWYETRVLSAELNGYHNTRGVVHDFKHRLFANIQKELKVQSQSLNFKFVVWYNFFQKPALHKSTIKNQITEKDIQVSHEVFEKLLEILKPNVVIFLSKLAFDTLQKDSNGKYVRKYDPEKKCYLFKEYEVPIYWAHHPNSSYWHSSKLTGSNGIQRFRNSINNIIRTCK